MASFEIPSAILSSGGRRMPLLGLGTASFPPVEPDTVKMAILEAIKVGYRHFDTSSVYKSEEPIGEAIAEALSLGLIRSRDELFITSKLWCSDAHGHLVVPALQRTLKKLNLEYLDLYLIHWPVSFKPVTSEVRIIKENLLPTDLLPMDFKSVWAAMENCQRLGLTKSIGVSNFSSKKLADILAFADIPPAVDQVEMNPVWQRKKLREFCKANGILVTLYAALGAKGTPWGSNKVMECEVLKEIAHAKGKTVAQICLRWAYEQGVSILVKSFTKERMTKNLQIFDWALTEEESKKISDIPQHVGCSGEYFTSEDGPFKTIEELWDGEI